MYQLEMFGGDRAPRTGIADLDAAEAARAVLGEILSAGATLLGLRGCRDCVTVGRIAARLAVSEAETGLHAGTAALIVIVDEPGLATALAGLVAARPRLAGLAFDPSGLARKLGISSASAPVRTARGLVPLAAAALDLPALLVTDGPADDAAGDGYRGLLRPRRG